MTDKRDLRDPQKLGEAFFNERRAYNQEGSFSIKAHEVADRLHLYNIQNYPQDELLSTVTAREYRQELQTAAESGDKYARNLLQERGWNDSE